MATLNEQPEVGTEVTVVWGKYGGRNGRVVRYERVERGGGRSSVYPVVDLDATPRAEARTVRVTVVTADHRVEVRPDGSVTCRCGVASPRLGTHTLALRAIRSHHEEVRCE